MESLLVIPASYRNVVDDISRPAPGVRNVDLFAAAGGVLVALGTTADVVGLLVARGDIASFCRRLVGAGRAREAASAELVLRNGSRQVVIRLADSEAEERLLAQMTALLSALEDESD